MIPCASFRYITRDVIMLLNCCSLRLQYNRVRVFKCNVSKKAKAKHSLRAPTPAVPILGQLPAAAKRILTPEYAQHLPAYVLITWRRNALLLNDCNTLYLAAGSPFSAAYSCSYTLCFVVGPRYSSQLRRADFETVRLSDTII